MAYRDRHIERAGRRPQHSRPSRHRNYTDRDGSSGPPVAFRYNDGWLDDGSSSGRRNEGYELWDRDPMYHYGEDRHRSRPRESRARTSSPQRHDTDRVRAAVLVSNSTHHRRPDHHDVPMWSSDSALPPPDYNPPRKTERGGALQLIKEFATNTSTAHGFPNMFKATTNVGRLIWTLIFLVALGVFLWQASILIKRFRLFPVAVELEIVTRSELEFPAVTLCNTNKVRRSAIMQSKYKEALTIDDGVTLPYYGPCIEGDFSCSSNNLCLKQFLRCDGINHCRDFSDEYGCDYETCSPGEFRCSNGSVFGVCISASMQCDRRQDCYNAEDEDGCPCKPTEFQCGRGGCIAKYLHCDGGYDCIDESDEEDCYPDTNCTGFFRCTSEDECISTVFVCDQDNDCLGGEDETPEACASVTPAPTSPPACKAYEFHCGDGTCIMSDWMCDEVVDCRGTGADEDPVLCGRDGLTYGEQLCDDVEWLCVNQWQCIYDGDRCNLEPDCFTLWLDSDDEYNCTCVLNGATTSSSQKVMCLGATTRATDITFPTVNASKFQSMSCYNNLVTDPKNNFVWDWDAFSCSGNILCTNVANNFPEPCEVLHECYIAPNAQDYRGTIDFTTSATPCLDWNDDVAIDAGFSPETYPELIGPVCRNPGGNRSGAWCFTVGATTADDWEYCYVGEPSATCHPGVDLPVRLAGRVSDSEGRVEVFHGGAWGTVSDTDWTMEDATVVCRQLGFEGALGRSTFAVSTGDIFMSQVECTGHESYLVDCHYRVVMPSDSLSHNMDVSVSCSGTRQKRQVVEEVMDLPPTTDSPVSCTGTEFQCSSGECVPLWQTCNNYPDCEDGSDEYLDDVCRDYEFECSVYETACQGANECIRRWRECDGYSDCPGGTDERFCNNPSEPCPEGYFRCNNSKCIHNFRICDTIVDCLSGEDEEQNCLYADEEDGRLNPFVDETWKDPFQDFIPEGQEELFNTFRMDFYTPRPFSRVLSEDPADWQRFVTFSEQPDYSDLSEVLKLTKEEISLYGHQAKDFILQCHYDGIECHNSYFLQVQNDKYGNCYTFNFKEDETAASLLNSSRTGDQSGLALTLYIEQDEFLSLYGQEAGVRVAITTPDVEPLPADEGINILPGTVTSIGLRYNVITRKPFPFGNCQVNKTTISKIEDGKIVRVETNNYNRKHCLRVCVLEKILEICNCSDSIELDGERCKLLDATQDVCKQMVYFLHSYYLLNCSCGTQCNDRLYTTTVSQSAWPSDAFRPHLLRNIHFINPKTRKIRSAEDISKNLVRLKIFFEELNYQETREVEDYSATSLFGDIGGTIGLYIGFSLLTVLEFIELIIYLIRTSCCRWTPTGGR